jgi:DNA-binding MarR family transcriptional regulator
MPVAKRIVKPRTVAAVRRLYENTNVQVRDLAAMLGISKSTFTTRRKEWGWKSRRDRIPREEPLREPDEIEPAEEGASRSDMANDKAALAKGMYALVRTNMDLIAKIMGEAGSDQADVAQEASRMNASLARTLQEIARFEQRAGINRERNANDRGPADDNEFARLLLRRLDEFRARRSGRVPDGAGGGGV